MYIFEYSVKAERLLGEDYPLFPQHIDRFNSFSECYNMQDCCEWIGTRDSKGYGIFSIRHKLFKAHRVAYALFYKSLDNNLKCCHSCDNPSCVNPHHLWLGTQLENIEDRGIKGRTRAGHLLGEDNPKSKLTEADVLEIREIYNPNTWSTRVLAERFKVSQTKIRQILTREAWKHI